MRVKRVLLWIVLFVFSASAAFAAPAYGTKMPKAKEAFWGIGEYTIFFRTLNKDHGELKSQQEHILLSYGVTDWFSLDLKASLGTIESDPYTGSKIKYDHPVWGGGYGFRVRLYENGPVRVVSGFQHISIHPKTVKGNGEKNNAILDDWQASALVSYDLKKFTPYTGLRYGTTDYIHRINNDADRVYSPESRRFDAVLGVDIPVSRKAWINLEGAFGSGEALATSLNFHF
ncbi:MAG: hypothetical protein HQL16_03680 [Candidatus Omnitrophica bacterium]|nr:hypothetical protein [Candidatus Omnitrophota bacterium]